MLTRAKILIISPKPLEKIYTPKPYFVKQFDTYFLRAGDRGSWPWAEGPARNESTGK